MMDDFMVGWKQFRFSVDLIQDTKSTYRRSSPRYLRDTFRNCKMEM